MSTPDGGISAASDGVGAQGMTYCGLVREGAAATLGGKCGSQTVACLVSDLATKRGMYEQAKWRPAFGSTDKAVRDLTMKNLRAMIDADVAAIKAEYGDDAETDEIEWGNYPYCLWSVDGSGGGPNGNRYFTREDIEALGYRPTPVVGTAATMSVIPEKAPWAAAAIPVWFDQVFAPGLAVVVLVIFLLLVLTALLILADRFDVSRTRQSNASKAKKAEEAREEVPTQKEPARRPTAANKIE